ncbi:MAG: YlbF family regulator [Chitinophagales bacterium]
MNRDDILKMAFQLGESIGECEEMQLFQESQANVIKDAEAYGLIMRYQETKMKFTEQVRQGDMLTEEQEKELDGIENEMQNHPLVGNMLMAQEKVNNLMNAVYFSINQALQGPSSCSSGSCEGCGGGCG